MKKNLLILLISIGITEISLAQYQTFSRTNNGTNSIVVPSGEIWQVVNWRAEGDSNYSYFGLDMGGDELTFYGTSGAFLSVDNPASSQPIGLIVQGPASLRAKTRVANTGSPYFMVVKKITSSSSPSSISAYSVVIPSSVTGDVDVKLEQSADNVTWTECLPGTYNSSTVKRFFRLRAVEK
jgi:hypothetical protein